MKLVYLAIFMRAILFIYIFFGEVGGYEFGREIGYGIGNLWSGGWRKCYEGRENQNIEHLDELQTQEFSLLSVGFEPVTSCVREGGQQYQTSSALVYVWPSCPFYTPEITSSSNPIERNKNFCVSSSSRHSR